MRPMASSRKPRKSLVFCGFFRNSRMRDRHVNDFRYAMNPAGTMPAASPPGGPGGRRGRGLWPNGPTRAAAGRRGGDAFLAFSPRPPDGGGGGTQHEPGAQRPTTLSFRAASPPGDHSGAERPGGRARRPPDPARTARPIASGTCCRHDAYSRRAGCWSGPAPKGTARGSPRAVEPPAGEVRPRQRAFVPAPTETMRGEVFTGARPRAATSDFFCGRRSPSIVTRPASPRRSIVAELVALEVRVGGDVRAGRAGRAVASGRVGSVGQAGAAGGPAAVAGDVAVALRDRGQDARGTAARRPARRPVGFGEVRPCQRVLSPSR